MKLPSDRFLQVLHLRPRPGFTIPSLLLLLASSLLVHSGIAANPDSDGPLRPAEAALIGIFKGTVEVTASDAKIDRAKLLDRVLASGVVDYVPYADDDRKTTRITTAPVARTPPGWPRGDEKPTTVGIPGESTSGFVRDGDSVVMPVQIELSQSVSVRYDPPEVRVFAGRDPKPVDMGVKV